MGSHKWAEPELLAEFTVTLDKQTDVPFLRSMKQQHILKILKQLIFLGMKSRSPSVLEPLVADWKPAGGHKHTHCTPAHTLSPLDVSLDLIPDCFNEDTKNL